MRLSLADLNIHEGFYYPRGTHNAITDVAGVRVGHATVIEGDLIRTGVTAIIPPVDFSKNSLLASGYVLNGNGEVTGLHYLLEEAHLTSPIFLTNTLSVGDVFSAVVDYYKGKIALPVIGECWDGFLNDIEGRHVKKDHVIAAIENATDGNVPQGAVGAGTGMMSFGFKAGIGTSSRVVELDGKKHTIGVLVNNNLGSMDGSSHRYLRIAGYDVAKYFGDFDPAIKEKNTTVLETHQCSTICIIATDVPLEDRQLYRVSQHAVLGMGRVGIVSYTGSGDFIITFSTANTIPKRGSRGTWDLTLSEETVLDVVFEALLEAIEEAYSNSILLATDMTGRDGRVARAFPTDTFLRMAKKQG